MAEEISISGLDELRKTLLKELPEALQGKASQIALSKAAKPIVTEAQSRAPSRKPRGFAGPVQPGSAAGGNLKRNIYSYRNRESTKTYESRFIGVRGKAFYWRWIEFGRGIITAATSLGNVRKGWFGKTVSAVPARPFMRPAFEANKLRAISLYAEAIKPAIAKVAAKSRAKSVKRIVNKLTGF